VAKGRATTLPPPYLKRVWLDPDKTVDRSAYPFCLPLFRGDFEIAFDTAVTIIAGENGVGKSTMIEAIAVLAGFDEDGGGQATGRSIIRARVKRAAVRSPRR